MPDEQHIPYRVRELERDVEELKPLIKDVAVLTTGFQQLSAQLEKVDASLGKLHFAIIAAAIAFPVSAVGVIITLLTIVGKQ